MLKLSILIAAYVSDNALRSKVERVRWNLWPGTLDAIMKQVKCYIKRLSMSLNTHLFQFEDLFKHVKVT